MTDHTKYEYLVTYKDGRRGIFDRRNGRVIKQTREAADNAVVWAKNHGCTVTLKRRSVGQWEDA